MFQQPHSLVQEPMQSHLTLHKAGAGISGDLNWEGYGWKLFHREQRPTPERHIIDASEWTCANYRYVIGQHWSITYTSESSELAALC